MKSSNRVQFVGFSRQIGFNHGFEFSNQGRLTFLLCFNVNQVRRMFSRQSKKQNLVKESINPICGSHFKHSQDRVKAEI